MVVNRSSLVDRIKVIKKNLLFEKKYTAEHLENVHFVFFFI